MDLAFSLLDVGELVIVLLVIVEALLVGEARSDAGAVGDLDGGEVERLGTDHGLGTQFQVRLLHAGKIRDAYLFLYGSALGRNNLIVLLHPFALIDAGVAVEFAAFVHQYGHGYDEFVLAVISCGIGYGEIGIDVAVHHFEDFGIAYNLQGVVRQVCSLLVAGHESEGRHCDYEYSFHINITRA